MFAPSSASLDAGAARRFLHHRRMFDSASSLAADSTPTILRTRRSICRVSCSSPLLRRRGNFTSSSGAHVLPGRWTDDCFAHGDVPAARRAYAMRKPPGKPPPPPPKLDSKQDKSSITSRGKPAQNDPMDSPYLAPRSFGGDKEARDQAQQLQKNLDDEKAGHAETKKQLLDKAAALKLAVAGRQEDQRGHDARLQDAEGQYRAQLEDMDRKVYSRVKQEQAATILEGERRLQNARQLENESIAQKEALSQAQSELKAHSVALEKGHKQRLEQAMTALKEKAAHEKLILEKSIKTANEAILEGQLRSLKEAADGRLRERGSYASYRQVWAILDKDAKGLTDSLASVSDMLERRVTYWREAQSNFKAERIHPWFPNLHPNITSALHKMLAKRKEDAIKALQKLQSHQQQLQQIESSVGKAGHNSRKLTRYHMFDDERMAHSSIALLEEYFNEVPLDKITSRLDVEIQQLDEQVANTARLQRITIEQQKAAKVKARENIIRMRRMFARIRSADMYENLTQAPPRAQEIYAKLLVPRDILGNADNAWDSFQRSRTSRGASTKGLPTRTLRQNSLRLKEKINQLQRDMTERHLLQEDLGQAPGQDEREAWARTITKAAKFANSSAQRSIEKLFAVEIAYGGAAPSAMRTVKSTRSKEARREAKANRRAPAQKPETRQASEGDVSGSDAKESPATSRRKRRRLKLREKRAEARAKECKSPAKEETSSEPSQGDKAGPGVNIKPTAPNKAPHVFWPTFSQSSANADPPPDLGKPLYPGKFDMDASNADSAMHSSQRSFESAESGNHEQLPLSQFSDSSYQPSNGTQTACSASQSTDTDSVKALDMEDSPHLKYNMSETDHRNAVLASPNTAAAYWTYKLYKDSDGKPPPKYYCTNIEQAEARASEFLNEPVIGFDIEWEMGYGSGKGGIKKNVSLIQIAVDDKIALFHIGIFKGDTIDELMPSSLRTVLESREVVKAGVNIQGDAARMKEHLGVEMTGIFELSHLYRVVMFSDSPNQINRKPFKLASQVQEVLLLPLKKDSVRTSAWSKRLDIQQTDYAASDAYAGFRLYHALEARRKRMDPMPPRPAFWEEHKPIQLGDGTLVQPKTRKKAAADAGKKPAAAADEDDENDEFFDAVESLDAYDLEGQAAKSAGVPLSGLSVPYPFLPSIDDNVSAALSGLSISADTSNKTTSAKTPRKTGPPPSDEVEQAERWVASWRASRPAAYTVKASHYQLRAYALWHHQSLACRDVAALLRADPLSLTTVATYVLEALKHENLEHDAAKTREVLGIIPSSAHARYGRIVAEVRE